MELAIAIIIGIMILGAIYAIHAKDLLSAVIACGIVGYGLVICFLLLKAPDLAIVQIVVETITLIIMVAVVLNSSREESYSGLDPQGFIHAAAGKTGAANLVTGVVFDFRGYDTLGEATVLITAVLGVISILRLKGKK